MGSSNKRGRVYSAQRSCSRRYLLWCSCGSKLSGAEFDSAYANEMVKEHEQDVAEFQKEAMGGKEQFAAKTLPTLESRLQQAREMQRTVQASSGK